MNLNLNSTKIQIAGWLVAITFVLGVLRTLLPIHQLSWFGFGYWIAALLLLSSMKIHRLKLSITLFIVGGLLLSEALYRGAKLLAPLPLATNSQIISLLVAASLLSKLGNRHAISSEELPTGSSAILKTTLAVHLIGSVINLSSVYLLGDRMSRKKEMDARQVLILTRGFAAAGFWSPFFITMAVALKYAPGSDPSTLFLLGCGMAMMALLITFYEVKKMGNPTDFVGYPFNVSTLWLPLVLILCVSALYITFPQIPPLESISLLVVILYLLYFLWRPSQLISTLHRQVNEELPQLASEIALFISAGVFSFAFALLLGTFTDWTPFLHFSFAEASICFAVIVLLSLIGLHPIASISFLGPVIATVSTNPNLAASVFLYAWALSSAISPFSSQNLGAFTRYRIDGSVVRLRNFRYGLIMAIFTIILLYGLSLSIKFS